MVNSIYKKWFRPCVVAYILHRSNAVAENVERELFHRKNPYIPADMTDEWTLPIVALY